MGLVQFVTNNAMFVFLNESSSRRAQGTVLNRLSPTSGVTRTERNARFSAFVIRSSPGHFTRRFFGQKGE
jgi:hypothetical protein